MTGSSQASEPKRGGLGWLPPRLLLAVGGVVVALVMVEIGLRVLGWPHFPEPHTETARFAFANVGKTEFPFYVNAPGRITFRYDGNPRGYFDERSEVHHDVNPSGFRGPAVSPDPKGAFRMVFLGDSFTFGEGVRNEDIYPEVTARLLRGKGRAIDACNLGVGGHNTTQSLDVLKRFGFGLQPDVVILGYNINDAEPPLFEWDPASGQPVRRPRERDIEAEAAPRRPPESGIHRLRLAQLAWNVKRQRELTRQTIDYYHSVNDPSGAGFRESERALREIISLCREREVPCLVVMFPLLYELSDDYPFQDIHQRVGRVVGDAGGHFFDLLPVLKGHRPAELIVHPTDQHPNEKVHQIVGELLAKEISQLPGAPGGK